MAGRMPAAPGSARPTGEATRLRVVRTRVLRDTSADRGTAGQKLFCALGNAALSCMLLAAGALGFSSCFANGGAGAFLAAGALAVLALHLLAAFAPTKSPARIAAVAAGAAAVLAIAAVPALQAGLFAFANEIISRFDDRFCAYAALLPTRSAAAPGWLFPAAAGVGAATLVWAVVEQKAAVALTALVFVPAAASVWLATGYGLPAFGLALVAWLAVWRTSMSRGQLSARTLAGPVLAGAAIAAVAGFAIGAYQPLPAVDSLRSGIVAATEAARFGQDTLPQGNLADAPQMNSGQEERLRLAVSQAADEDLYLRGFVGASLTGSSWQALDHTAYEGTWAGLFDWLELQGFSPDTQHALFADEDASNGASQPATQTIAVNATGANRKYVYAPTTLRLLSGAQTVSGRDGSMLASGLLGARSYTLQADASNALAEAQTAPAWLGQLADDQGFTASEAVYRSFAEDNYLQLSDEDRQTANRLFFDDTTWDGTQDASVATVASRIRAMLETFASYTEDPAAAPDGAPFLSWFLETEHQGNSAYFSTAAVLAFRAQGIPARYAEGYLATAEDVAGAQAADGSLSLTAADAHAWVEVYLDGAGWCPVEVTPGFYRQLYSAQDVIEVNQRAADGTQEETQQAGALGGDLPPEDQDPAPGMLPALPALRVALVVLAVLVGAAAVALLALEVRRRVLRLRRAKRCASDNQAVSVPELFSQTMRLARAGGVPVDPARPFEATAAVAAAFPDVAEDEYERIVGLVQGFTFGQRELRPHELRAVRRFNDRLMETLPGAESIGSKLARRYRYGV